MPDEHGDEDPKGNVSEDKMPVLRLTLGRDLVALGFLIVFASLGLAIVFFRSASDVTTVIAPIVTMVGTLVGTVFGVQVATQGAAAAVAASTSQQPGDSTTSGNPKIEDF